MKLSGGKGAKYISFYIKLEEIFYFHFINLKYVL